MCGCSETHASNGQTTQTAAAALVFKVEDMTCGHCAGTIKKAIESSLPGALVNADPASRLVSITGAGDRDALADLITRAGYTPASVPA